MRDRDPRAFRGLAKKRKKLAEIKVKEIRKTSRLSIDPAQDTTDWRWPSGVHGGKDGLPRFLDDDDAGTHPENPDIGVPSGTRGEDGQQEQEEEEDAEEPGSKESGRNHEEQEKKADDDRRHGNSKVPREAAEQGREGKNGDTLTDGHAPGGTWLMKGVSPIVVREYLRILPELTRSKSTRGEEHVGCFQNESFDAKQVPEQG
ncbi:hypothetical protein NDU88_002246 [Pleurodeles waltl]|uniref:Uncharacterized protein n=1 Tax=Pleurodeles waltl TaxID=8319 RepID=A0AAV7ND70_PLEWA|nr:hypothetical protein NDU88_002246 [Pleurodeles waltl]